MHHSIFKNVGFISLSGSPIEPYAYEHALTLLLYSKTIKLSYRLPK